MFLIQAMNIKQLGVPPAYLYYCCYNNIMKLHIIIVTTYIYI